MYNSENISSDLFFIFFLFYAFLAATVAKLGSVKECGSLKALLISILLTPATGIIYVISSHKKNVLKIVHYRCSSCGLEHTSKHEFCPTCRKEGKHRRLIKICMQTY
jgi:hypothetical protein